MLVDKAGEIMQQQYDVFISFNSEDKTFAQEVYDFLSSRGIRVFLGYRSLARQIGWQ
jgi:hypothetical protein